MARRALVTGASSGIGAETARQLVAAGFDVVGAARRVDRLAELASEVGITPYPLDVTSQESVDRLAAEISDLDLLVNNAGGAFGFGPVEGAEVEDWQRMYETNVLGTLRLCKAFIPLLERGGGGHIVNVTSTAGHTVYEGGVGYNAAKFAQAALTTGLRLELNGRPIRVTEVQPGMVRTEEFAVVRFGGDRAAAERVYEGVAEPLTAADVADAIVWAATRPAHVDIDAIVLQPVAQAAPYKLHRGPIAPR